MIIKISKSKIEKRLRKKTNPVLVQTLIRMKKENPEVARLLALPRRKAITMNLEQLNQFKDGEKILVPGKVLGNGNIEKKIKVAAFSASKEAMEKMKKAKVEFVLISEGEKLNDYKIAQ